MSAERDAIRAAWRSAMWSRWVLRSRADIERRQAKLWRAMAATVARTPAIAHLAGRPLEAFPVVEPAAIRADFPNWNTRGVTRDAAQAAAAEAERGGAGEVAPGVVAGFSTGSWTTRGFFLTGPQERARYVGQALARLLSPRDLIRGAHITLVLRADNQLYRDVEQAGRFRFRFYGLDMDAERRLEALNADPPDYLIAPAHILAALARTPSYKRRAATSRLRRLFWGAEPMGYDERAWIAGELGTWPDPIYQATEGFLGAPCRFGTLHLNEDAMVIELEPVEGTGVFRPVVTDLHRTTQPMVRVRLDDLVEPVDRPCRCGSPMRVIRPVEGRVSDLWRWPDRTVRPARVWSAMEAALGPSAEWSAEASPAGVRVQCGLPRQDAVREALAPLIGDRPIAFGPDGRNAGAFPKRRRVRWRD